jgi:hypothetical protein
MKTLLLITLLLAAAVRGQDYSIDWFEVAGGGGTSTGDVYSVSGTIGQLNASAAMTGGDFSVTGGFWSLLAVQTPGAPLLTIAYSGPKAVISWPSSSTGFVLQQNSDLTTTNWTASVFTLSDDGTNKSITITSPTGNLFFRLSSP